jgi:hypothetical protein
LQKLNKQPMEKLTKIAQIFIFLLFSGVITLSAQHTHIQYLSGTGSDHTIDWEFFCTAGMKSGYWTTIPVPSCWELQGFGKYNYGHDKDEDRGKEKGLYRHRFPVPADWKDKSVRIVFEGSMTDTEVKINGKSAGALHQGAFYRFSYDISSLLRYGRENLLEVTVAKHSANESVNEAERRCDYWIFGGIFRPVYLEAKPRENIERIALDAKADGTLNVDVFLSGKKNATLLTARVTDLSGNAVGQPFTQSIPANTSQVRLSSVFQDIKTWTPEFPELYMLEVSLEDGVKTLHQIKERFGFRTVELRLKDGIYVNDVKIKFKGVNRHSFWPTTGRTLSRQHSINDVLLMKEMNMNAVRMSHYPPDKHFLEVCDSLGLFVLNELAGWQTAYDTPAGSILAQSLLKRDVNHPSIVIWDNGNEGGWNFELDHWFDELDPQKRPLIHPWDIFRGTDTQHYKDYDYGTGTHQHGQNVAFPTEFLHGLYDGGHGAGLEDYWNQMWYNPLSAGGFLWVFADEGVVRTDRNGEVDTYKNNAPDGILGPYHEKEGSFYTIRELWAPIFFERRYITPQFNGQFRIENRYHYTNLSQCTFRWELGRLSLNNTTPHETVNGTIAAPDLMPGRNGTLQINLPGDFYSYDVLYITATDPHGNEIYTWSWPVSAPAEFAAQITRKTGNTAAQIAEDENEIRLSANGVTAIFSKKTGLLNSVLNSNGKISLGNGPVPAEGEARFREARTSTADGKVIIDMMYDGIYKSVRWTMHPSGWLQLELSYLPPYETSSMGISFDYPEEKVKGMRWIGAGPYRVWKNRMKGNAFGVWEKAYNNTITGEEWIYPEFKGFHKDFYAVQINTDEQPFTIVCGSEDVFLRMFTPEPPKGAYNQNTAPVFPSGSISFLHGISAIGTKFKKPEVLGPMSQKNKFYTQGRKFTKDLDLWFDFNK